tara:strand:+ start:189 stop:500 length:312 start_codon:yes stop_codon:yes gene_type:complete
MEEIAKIFIGEWGWMFVAGVFALAFRDAINKTWSGLLFLVGNDFNVDDIVWINGTKKARIVRQSVFKTTFYLYDHQRKFIVPNDRIWLLNIEKDLPKQKRLDT